MPTIVFSGLTEDHSFACTKQFQVSGPFHRGPRRLGVGGRREREERTRGRRGRGRGSRDRRRVEAGRDFGEMENEARIRQKSQESRKWNKHAHSLKPFPFYLFAFKVKEEHPLQKRKLGKSRLNCISNHPRLQLEECHDARNMM